MKKLFSLFVILLPHYLFSQNYKVVSDVLPSFYQADNGYYYSNTTMAFAIDTFTVHGSDTLFLTFTALRDSSDWFMDVCLDSLAGSVMGRRLLQQNDRTVLFNAWGDSIFVYQNTVVGDRWNYYKYGDGSNLEAEHVESRKQEVVGVFDSVKVFELVHKNIDGGVIEDEINGLQVQLSKQFGFIETFDNYLFPKDTSKRVLIGCENPRLGAQNINAHSIFDFEVGDEFHLYNEDLYWYFDITDTAYNIDHGKKKWTIRNVMQRINYDDSVTYEFYDCSRVFDYLNRECDTIYQTETVFETIVFDSILPGILDAYTYQYIDNEAYGGDLYFEIIQGMSTMLMRQVKGITSDSYMKYDSCILRSLFDPCCLTDEFVDGCGGPYFKWSNWFDRTTENKLLYFNKNGKKGGVPVAEDCEDLSTLVSENSNIDASISVFPNPFTSELKIQTKNIDTRILRVKLINIQGYTLQLTESSYDHIILNTSSLDSGLYLLEIHLVNGIVVRKKVVKK